MGQMNFNSLSCVFVIQASWICLRKGWRPWLKPLHCLKISLISNLSYLISSTMFSIRPLDKTVLVLNYYPPFCSLLHVTLMCFCYSSSSIDVVDHFSLNQSRTEEITLKENFGNSFLTMDNLSKSLAFSLKPNLKENSNNNFMHWHIV